MQWLYLQFHSLQLDSLLDVSQSNQATIVVDPSSNKVVQKNHQAGAVGVKLEMGIAMSISLSSEIRVLEYRPTLEAERLSHIAERLYRVTSDIALDPPQGLYLRIDNMLRLYRDLNEYWLTITGEIAELKLRYHYATASTPEMSKVLATSASNTLFEDMTEARQALNKLPIERLYISSKQKEQLRRVGVKTISKLLAIPLKDMAKRFDLAVFNYLGQLSGELRAKLIFFRPQRVYRRTLELLFEISNAEILQHPIKKMLLELESYLKVRNLVSNQLRFELCYRYKEFVVLEVERADGCYHAEKWLTLIKLKLESVKLSEPVVSIRLLSHKLSPHQARLSNLFNSQQSQVDKQELQSVLEAKLGSAHVNYLQFIPTIDPATCTEYSDNNNGTLSDDELLKGRPSFLLAKPCALCEKVELQYGPERILTNWWLGKVAYRDYFVATNTNGQWLWIYRTPQQNWFKHGYFS